MEKAEKAADEMGKEIKDSGEQADDAKGKFSGFTSVLSGMGTALKAAAAATAAAVAGAATAIGALTTKAIEGYAAQEQLVGGVETLFKTSSDTVVGYANDASIADLNMQLGFLWEELQGYTAVMDALKKAGSVRAASDAVLTGYEKPADQSETVKKKRAEYGEGYYKKYAAGNGTKYYRVRKSWTDAASQLGAFTSLENAKSACKAGYTVYDDNGKAVYTAAGQQASAGVPFSVQVDILDLNIRTGAGTNYAKTGETTGKGVFTIVEVKAGQGASAGWGRLKSGAGWISLDYATRLA